MGQRQALLLEALADRSSYVAALAAEALGEGVDDRAALAMTERFGLLCEDGHTRDPGCQIRANLAFALGRLEYRPAADMLRVGIRTVQIEPVGGVPFDTAAHLRANCALALAQLRDVDAVRDIALLLFDRAGYALRGVSPDPTLKMEPRKAAARALALTGSVQARLPLICGWFTRRTRRRKCCKSVCRRWWTWKTPMPLTSWSRTSNIPTRGWRPSRA